MSAAQGFVPSVPAQAGAEPRHSAPRGAGAYSATRGLS